MTIELERYELREQPVHHFDLDRRDFAKFSARESPSFLFPRTRRAAAGRIAADAAARAKRLPKDIADWLHIAENGAITVYTGKVEIGQNIRTSLAQVVAEELHAPFESIQMVMGDTKLTPYDAGTFGSQTTPRMGMQLRRIASGACDTLRDLAAKQWGVDGTHLVAANGKITDPQTKRSISYGQLAQGKALAKAIPDTDPLVPPAEWIVAGKPLGKVDGRDFVTGKHKYTSDVKFPGMLYGKVLRPGPLAQLSASVD